MEEAELIHLFAHEIGHILGLGHSPDEGNIMNAVVSNLTTLGPGDVAGINAVMRPCASPSPRPELLPHHPGVAALLTTHLGTVLPGGD